jgi:hypothetical protein
MACGICWIERISGGVTEWKRQQKTSGVWGERKFHYRI